MIEINKEFINKVLTSTCTDLNPRDREYMTNLIDENIPKELTLKYARGAYMTRLYEIISASAYLYSKCPGNTDNVINYRMCVSYLKDLYKRASLTRGVKIVKELGFIKEYCTVTSTIILRNMKNQLSEMTKTELEGFSKRDMEVILDYAIELSESEIAIRDRQGKGPYAVASGCFYLAALVKTDEISGYVTQRFVGKLFNVTVETIRRRYKAILTDELEDLIPYKRSESYFIPKVRCKDCIHLGELTIDKENKFSFYDKYHTCNAKRAFQTHDEQGNLIEIYTIGHRSRLSERRCEYFQEKGVQIRDRKEEKQ